jgi:protocatechuate 3,4-dioxygenase beta subunit
MLARTLSRLQLLRLAAAAVGTYLAGSRAGEPVARLASSQLVPAADAAALSCVLSPAKTEGPYFVDERLNRSDIRTDPSNGSVQAGIPLRLTINVYDVDDNCAAVEGATVDVWHANAAGVYSDVAANGTTGRKFLRGYQATDASGAAEFVTAYPGWYSGRAIHIHFKVRLFDGSSKTYEFTSQIFFDEAVNDAVTARSPYSARGRPDTRNSGDNIYGADGSQLIVALSADGNGGYAGTFGVGLSGLPSSAARTDSAVGASLLATRFSRTAAGERRLTLTLDVDETVSADVRLLRGSRTVVRKRYARLRSGTRKLTVDVGSRVAAGTARLRLTLADGNGNVRTVARVLRIPPH